jgi:hypothetical protein
MRQIGLNFPIHWKLFAREFQHGGTTLTQVILIPSSQLEPTRRERNLAENISLMQLLVVKRKKYTVLRAEPQMAVGK